MKKRAGAIVTSLIILSFNTKALLEQCLRSVETHFPEAEVVVVDNASIDGSTEMVAREFPRARLIALAENLGFAAGNNLGLTHAKGDSVVLLNSDTVLEDDSLRRCAAHLDDHPEVGAVGPRLVGVDGVEQTGRHRDPGLFEDFRVALRRPRTPPGGFGPIDDGRWWLAGTALVVRKAAIESVGTLLDEDYFFYWEDADLSARLRAAGWKLAYLGDAHVVHHGGASGGGPKDVSRRLDLATWLAYGRLLFFERHRPRWESAGAWLGDAIQAVRILIRAAIRPSKRDQVVTARAMARVLGLRMLGRAPKRPSWATTSRQTKAT